MGYCNKRWETTHKHTKSSMEPKTTRKLEKDQEDEGRPQKRRGRYRRKEEGSSFCGLALCQDDCCKRDDSLEERKEEKEREE